MDLKLSDLMLMSLMKIKEAVDTDGLEKALGKNILYGDQKQAQRFDKDDIAGFERVLIEDTTENLYALILTRPEVLATALSSKDLKAPKDVKGYSQNMQKIFTDLLRFEGDIKKAVENDMEKSYILFRSEEVRKSFAEFMVFMKKIYPYFETASKIEKVSRKTNGMGEEFFGTVPQLNEQIRNILHGSSEVIGEWRAPGVVFDERYKVIMGHFDENSEYVDSKKASFDEIQQQRKELLEQRRQVVKVPELSNEELIRRKCIQEANMMYDELVRNTMRDLEKQTPYSVREMYDYFVNVKFAKFVKSFSMPLDANTKINTAKEALNQLNELNNYVSRISENSITTNIYMTKE